MTAHAQLQPLGEWAKDAACQNELHLMFGPEGETQPARLKRERKAKPTCMACPVRTDCLDYAITCNVQYGVWGGMGEDERSLYRRRAMKNARNAAAKAAAREGAA